MGERRYTVCTYYPDLLQPAQAYDFAVLAASSDVLALVGMNLAVYGIKDENPVAQAIIDNTFDVMVRRIEQTLQSSASTSFLDVLDRIVEGNQTNIQYRRMETEESDQNPVEIAVGAFIQLARRQNIWPVSSHEEEAQPDVVQEGPARSMPTQPTGGAGRGRSRSRGRGRTESMTHMSRRVEMEVFA